MDNRPIGIFDSGLGGLTAINALRRLMPDENIVYFGDTGRLPYGAKTAAQLRHMAVQDLSLMQACGVKVILVACGTLSSNAAQILDACPIPAFGVLRPSVEAMARVGGTGPLGILATEATVRSGAFEAALRASCPGREILAVPCPDFVPLIETGHTDPADPLLRQAVETYAGPLRGASAVLLGCTHYGIISRALSEFLGGDTLLVSASDCGARAVQSYLLDQGLAGGLGEDRYLTSGDPQAFAAAASLLLGKSLEGRVESLAPMRIEP